MESKHRIVLLTQDYFPDIGGITTWTHEVGVHLRELGYDVVCVTRSYDGWDGAEDHDLPVIRLPHRKWRKYKYLWQLREIRKYDPQRTMFLCSNWKMSLACAVLSLFRPVSFIVAAHGLDVVADRPRDRRRQKWVMGRAKKIIAVSRFTAGLLERMELPEGKVVVIPNGVDAVKFHVGTGRNAAVEKKYGLRGALRVLTLGRLVQRKGFDMTIRALALAKSHDIEYYIAGKGGHGKALGDLAEELGVADRVHLLGFVPDEDLEPLFHSVDLFSMPSRRIGWDVEGFGITYLEAAACGLPSIGGKGSGAEDAIQDGITGVLVDPESPEEIAAVLDDARSNPERYRIMGRQARQRVEDELNWRSIARRIAGVMEE